MTRSRLNRGKSRKSVPESTSVRRQQRNNAQTNGQARTPLLPVGVNNRATMPMGSSDYMVVGEEVVEVINVSAGSTAGQLVFNELITPQSTRRLGILSSCWQRVDWRKASLNLVALNGSTVASGYTMGWLEDPEAPVPTDSKDIIPFLTALRSTTVRQNWVQSESGCQVATPDKPEMYTQRGSDIRRFSPGRLIIAVAGDVTIPATFQLMLKYNCRLYVPFAGVGGVDPGLPGQRGTWPLANNITVSTASITYPGIGTSIAPNATVTTVGIVAAMESANPSPTANVRLFPPGTRVTMGTLAGGGSVAILVDGTAYYLAQGDVSTGQFRAFTPIPVTGTPTNLRTLSWV